LPDWYNDRPPFEIGDLFYLEAFMRLQTCRQIGMSLGPIPWTAVHAYGVAAGLDALMLLVFEKVIAEMDSAFLEWCENERPKAEPATLPQPELEER